MPANYYPNVTINSINIAKLIEYSFADCGVLREQQTPQLVEAARQALRHVVQSLPNNLTLLFNYRYILFGSRANQTIYPLPPGTIDIKVFNFRYAVNPVPDIPLPTDNPNAANAWDKNLATFVSATAVENWLGGDFGAAGIRPVHIGINAYAPSGPATYNIILESSADGVTWTTVFTPAVFTLNDNEWQYLEVDGTPIARYWRVRSTTTSILAVREIVLGTVQQDITMSRLNRDDYLSLPNKTGFIALRALQYYLQRDYDTPKIYLWPTPIDDFQIYYLLVEKQLEDIGKLGDIIRVPDRWVGAIQAMLSAKLSLQLPGIATDRIQLLHELAHSSYSDASGEERDKSPFFLRPNTSYYVYNR